MNNYVELNGDKYWYLEDNDRRSCAAIGYINNQFYIKGKLCHREDGPAIEYSNGVNEYFQYGKRHRIGGPAIESPNGYKVYYENHKFHREDGPAIEWFDGSIEYWLCDKFFKTKEEWEHYRDYLIIME